MASAYTHAYVLIRKRNQRDTTISRPHRTTHYARHFVIVTSNSKYMKTKDMLATGEGRESTSLISLTLHAQTIAELSAEHNHTTTNLGYSFTI